MFKFNVKIREFTCWTNHLSRCGCRVSPGWCCHFRWKFKRTNSQQTKFFFFFNIFFCNQKCLSSFNRIITNDFKLLPYSFMLIIFNLVLKIQIINLFLSYEIFLIVRLELIEFWITWETSTNLFWQPNSNYFYICIDCLLSSFSLPLLCLMLPTRSTTLFLHNAHD